jgi:hypothetical protein
VGFLEENKPRHVDAYVTFGELGGKLAHALARTLIDKLQDEYLLNHVGQAHHAFPRPVARVPPQQGGEVEEGRREHALLSK